MFVLVLEDGVVMHHHVFETAFGFCGIAWTARGISRFMLPVEAADLLEESFAKYFPHSLASQPWDAVAGAVTAAQRYFAGEREDFAAFPLDLSGVDAFRRAIYQAARRLVYAQTSTYGALAAEAGFPDAARQTGMALGRNPIPLMVPCHRVVATGGKLGGFSAPGGTLTKQKMLALERAAPPEAIPAQASFSF